MPRRLDAGKLLVAVGAVALLVSLFLDWFGAEDRFAFDDGSSAWTVFEIVDLLLAALAVAAIFAAVEGLIRPGRARVPDALARIAGPAALVLVIAALLNHPPAAIGQSIEEGGWIALAAALLMTIGALLGFARIALVVAPREQGPGAAPPPAGPGDAVAQPHAADPTPGEVQTEPPTQPLPPDPHRPR